MLKIPVHVDLLVLRTSWEFPRCLAVGWSDPKSELSFRPKDNIGIPRMSSRMFSYGKWCGSQFQWHHPSVMTLHVQLMNEGTLFWANASEKITS